MHPNHKENIMRVELINGSPHPKGSTSVALLEVERTPFTNFTR